MLIFIVSCTQYEHDTAKSGFEYSIYTDIKDQSISFDLAFLTDFKEKKRTEEVDYEALLLTVNEEYNTNVTLPEDLFETISMSEDDIQSIYLEHGFMDSKQIEVLDKLVIDIGNDGFDIALVKFEDNVLNLGVTQDQFDTYNVFANSIKTMNEVNPEIFVSNMQRTSKMDLFKCLAAIAGLGIAVFRLNTCLTFTRCVVAYIGFLLAVYAMSACNTNKY